MSQQYPSRIRYEYEQDPETRLQYTHGVWGGINPQGEIEISFYLESDKMRLLFTHTKDKEAAITTWVWI